MSSIDHASIRVDPAPAPARRVPIRLRVAQVLLLLTGAVGVAGATYFGVVNPDDAYAWWVTAIFAPAAFAIGAGRIVAVFRLRTGSAAARRFTVAVVLAGAVYSLLKLVLFGETEAMTFGVIDLVVLVLVTRRGG